MSDEKRQPRVVRSQPTPTTNPTGRVIRSEKPKRDDAEQDARRIEALRAIHHNRD